MGQQSLCDTIEADQKASKGSKASEHQGEHQTRRQQPKMVQSTNKKSKRFRTESKAFGRRTRASQTTHRQIIDRSTTDLEHTTGAQAVKVVLPRVGAAVINLREKGGTCRVMSARETTCQQSAWNKRARPVSETRQPEHQRSLALTKTSNGQCQGTCR